MPQEIVVGLFRTEGTAEDVRNRLLQQGVPAEDIELRQLAHDTVLPPKVVQQGMFSFMDWLFGEDLPQRYGVHVTNGETALSVRGRDAAEREATIATMRLFAPLTIDVVSAPQEAAAAQSASGGQQER
jgi:hypothetical protein